MFRPAEQLDINGGMSSDAASDVVTSEGIDTDDGLDAVNRAPSHNVDLMSMQDSIFSATGIDGDLTSVPRQKRVLVFTTTKLLGLLALSRRGAVDGTFKAIINY